MARDSAGPSRPMSWRRAGTRSSRPRRRLSDADNAPPSGLGPFQRRSRTAQPPPMTTGCMREAGTAGRATGRPPLCGEAPGQRRTLGV
eukprot:scaffold99336_cov28-Phaeocystis_antarctica.AAC.1